jgi:Zn-dependent peptidase ImmA (M78 family)
MNRKSLLRQAAQAAVDLRDELDLDQFGPADPYAAAAALGVKVLFLDASMEGFYSKGPPARILLSALRPLPRRAFTCAHELGHHRFGHGATIDRLQADERDDNSKPDEVLANGFAAFFLMPTIGLRRAFAKRGWKAADVTPQQLFTVASEFGVGYTTLLNHLSYTLADIGEARRAELDRATPQKIRRDLVGTEFEALLLIDEYSEAATYDIERGTAVLLPKKAFVAGGALTLREEFGAFGLYQGARRGVATVDISGRACAIRVAPCEYVGPAGNRFLEDPDEQD